MLRPPMPRSWPLILGLALSLGACAQIAGSRLNPFNWFGPSISVASSVPREDLRPLVPEGRRTVVTDSRVLIGEVTALTVEPTPTGAIIRATGVAPTQGFHNAQLVLTGQSDGVLRYDFRVAPPTGFEAVGSLASRRIAVATTLTQAELAGVRRVEVMGQANARVTSR